MNPEEILYEKIWKKKLNDFEVEKGSRIDVALKLLDKGGTLLDIGCGNGTLGYLAKHKFERIYGVDISESALKVAKKRGLVTKKININDEKIPYDNNFFDALVCLDVIEHVYEPLVLMNEIKRVLKDNGILVISTPNIRYWKHISNLIMHGKFPRTADENGHWDGGHIHYFTFKDMEKILIKNNFVILKKMGVFGKNIFKDFRSTGVVIKAKKKSSFI